MLRGFQWKIGNVIAARSDPATRAGDGYAARICHHLCPRSGTCSALLKAGGFAHMLYGETPPHAALTHVFTHIAAVATPIITSPCHEPVGRSWSTAIRRRSAKRRQFERTYLPTTTVARSNEELTRISVLHRWWTPTTPPREPRAVHALAISTCVR